jgi:hypothetical protein
MVKGAIGMNCVKLRNLEIKEYCMLDKSTGVKEFYKVAKYSGFTGLYFRDDNSFLAIYPTQNGPVIFYDGREYAITPDLDISLQKNGKDRIFQINEYNIKINYRESPYIDFDNWSEEEDVDLLFRIEQSYKTQSFYERYTLNSTT